MAKDPAFLFYSKDWLEGTAEMTPDEKGVYIDLLAHQHQKGSLPPDTKRLAKMVGIPEDDFLKVWALLSEKFNRTDDRLVNRKLSEVTTDRLSKSHTNRITGKFATLIRSVKHLSKDNVETLKKEFKITDFDRFPTDLATERLTEWFHIRLQSIGDANANVNGTANTNTDSIGGEGEKKGSGNLLIPQMQQLWVTTFPTYTVDRELDFPALRSIADFIFKNAGVKNGYGGTDLEIKVLNTFQLIADQVGKDVFWVNKPLSSISKNIQEFYNKIKNPINGTVTKQTGRTAKLDDDILKSKLAAKRKEWQQDGR
jgi:uncharacterized protein YdaU (DUF1376 family)